MTITKWMLQPVRHCQSGELPRKVRTRRCNSPRKRVCGDEPQGVGTSTFLDCLV